MPRVAAPHQVDSRLCEAAVLAVEAPDERCTDGHERQDQAGEDAEPEQELLFEQPLLRSIRTPARVCEGAWRM